jgi:hypothetical protein
MDEVTREAVIRRLIAGKLAVSDGALVLGLSERQVWRLRARFLAMGADGLAHGNVGHAPANRIAPAVAARVVAFARDAYKGINDSHLTDLLAAREGITLSRKSIQRILRAAGVASPRRHRTTKYRARRARRPAPGMLVQLDASRHRWFGPDRPYASLVGAIDDATGIVLAARFAAHEDGAGYLCVLQQILEHHGVPLAVYSDKHSIFVASPHERESISEELAGERAPTQFGRALGELGVELILAHSPQAKGRIERLWGTFQDRLVAELRLAHVCSIEQANAFVGPYLARHNTRFAVAAADPAPAWRMLPAGQTAASVCCFKYARMVSADNTVRLDGAILQLPPRAVHWSWAHQRVEVRQHLDGSWSVHAPGGIELAHSSIPAAVPTLRARAYARAPIGGVPPLKRGANSPWRKGYQDWHPAAARRTIRRDGAESA